MSKKAYIQAENAVRREQVALLNDTRAEVLRLLGVAAAEVRTALASAPGEFQAWYLPQLQAEIERVMGNWSRQSGGLLTGALSQSWELGQAVIDRPLAAGLEVAGRLPYLDAKLLTAMQAFATDRIKNVSAVAVNAINGELALVTIGAQPVNEAIAKTQAHLGGTSKARAATIVRTALASSASTAADLRARQAAAAGVAMDKVWRRSGKKHPRLSHVLTDGQRRPLDRPFVLGMREVPDGYAGGGIRLMYPHDPAAPAAETINCGCITLYRPRRFAATQSDHKPFTARELAENPKLADREEARQNGKSIHAAQAAAMAKATGKSGAGKIAAMPSADRPQRAPWGGFPDVLIQAGESAVKKHPDYPAAKAGDVAAAVRLVAATLDDANSAKLAELAGPSRPRLVGVHAVEGQSVNVIPTVMAAALAERLAWPVETGLIQVNRVGHTGASGFHRLATPALFSGEVARGGQYVLVDDFVGQGGTLANLRGYIEQGGGQVLAATALTGKPYSAILAATSKTLAKLRAKHGQLEDWWRQRYGYGFELLTESEARYLERAADADAIRAGLAAAAPAGGGG